MSGISCAMLGAASSGLLATMTVGSSAYAIAKQTYYVDGFIATGSNADVIAPAIGALAPDGFSGAAVKALYWVALVNHSATNGSIRLELTGNRALGFVSDVKVNGGSLGAPSAVTYNSTENTTSFTIGTSGTFTNPFGTSGTKTIFIS